MTETLVNCPDCEVEGVLLPLEVVSTFDTDWYGRLTYYHCATCDGEFVQCDDGEIEMAAD